MTRAEYKSKQTHWSVMDCGVGYAEANPARVAYGNICWEMMLPFEKVLRLQVLVTCYRRLEMPKHMRRHWLEQLRLNTTNCPLP